MVDGRKVPETREIEPVGWGRFESSVLAAPRLRPSTPGFDVSVAASGSRIKRKMRRWSWRRGWCTRLRRSRSGKSESKASARTSGGTGSGTRVSPVDDGPQNKPRQAREGEKKERIPVPVRAIRVAKS